MRIISSSELQRRTGQVLAEVAAGESIVVERNGVPVAVIGPAAPSHLGLRDRLRGRVRQLCSDDELLAPVMDEL